MYNKYVVVKILYSLCCFEPCPRPEDFGDEITNQEYRESVKWMDDSGLIKNIKSISSGQDTTLQIIYGLDEAEMTSKGMRYLKSNKDILKLEPKS